MSPFLKLLNFEWNRFFKIFLTLIGLTLVFQIIAVFKVALNYMNKVTHVIHNHGLTNAGYVAKYGTTNAGLIVQSSWFWLSLIMCVAVMVIYLFAIWYRDWVGRAAFIYQLLMLPVSRLTLFWAKTVTIFLGGLGLVAFQLLFFCLELPLFKILVPKVFRNELDLSFLIGNNHFLTFLIPTSPTTFILTYLAVFMVVLVLFTTILFERCFHFKGVFLGLIYLGLSVALFSSPAFFLHSTGNSYLYPFETTLLEIALGVIVSCGAIVTSNYLLQRKITV